jgi:rubredoxin
MFMFGDSDWLVIVSHRARVLGLVLDYSAIRRRFSHLSPLFFSFVRAMAEASYRATILAGGKNQKKLTVGWEVLGLERQVAQRMFDEEAKEGFISEREAMYGGQKRKYDKKGNIINEEGKLADPENAIPDDDDAASEGPVSNVHECGQCGFTLFVAQGREDKFFGSSFVCPECGAAKDQFKAGGDDDDEE